jgi:hypothetical protein
MNYPALLKSFTGTIYHITDDGHKTRCGRNIDALTESHALALENNERCHKCGTFNDFDQINQARIAEEIARNKEHLDKLAEIAAVHAARSAVRPGLVNGIINFFSVFGKIQKHKVHLNMDELRIPVTAFGQRFTVKIEIWNGDHE